MERIPSKKPVGEILLVMSLLAIASILFLRRVIDSTLGDLPAAEVALYAALFAAIAGFAMNRLATILPAYATVMLAFLLSLTFAAGLSADPFDAFASLLAIIASLAIPFLIESSRRATQSSSAPSDLSQTGEISPRSSPETHAEVDDGLPVDDANDANIAQSLTRREIGADSFVEGMLTFEIGAGETIHQLHVPFWPALPAPPNVECELDGLDARVRVPLAAPHGLRIEVRAAQPSNEPRSGIVHFTAHAPASRAAA